MALSWGFYKNKRPVKTASDVQVRNKIYSSSVNSWRNYQKCLEKEFENLKISPLPELPENTFQDGIDIVVRVKNLEKK